MVKRSSSTSKKISKFLPATVVGFGLCAAMSLPARAEDFVYNGNFCTPMRADANKFEYYAQWGVANASNTPATVQCPFIHRFTHSSVPVNRVVVTLFDRHPQENVTCTLYGLGLEGSIVWQVSRSSSGSGTQHQMITLTPPQQGVAGINMLCTLPGLGDNSWESHVTSYWVSTP